MKFDIRLGDKDGHLELQQKGGDWTFRADWAGEESREGTASVLEVEPGVYSVLANGRSFEVRIIQRDHHWLVDVDGREYPIEVLDPRSRRGRKAGAVLDGRQNVTAPMPGKVVRVLVAQGDSVQAGQGLVVVEAMKMQNELRAPRDGVVVQLSAREGAAVAAGEVLVTIE
ncbi:MAG: biotin/lipoyl-binding protein [Bryobacteraceae bacterium]|nr:biotin/lipoyl-binding protein [Bryobacteraceae bacterium]